jgi:hypothetical protein
MSENDDLKHLWKEEREQLKQDLNNREKVVQKREVPIRFNTKKKQVSPSQPKDDGMSDSYLRSQLGL